MKIDTNWFVGAQVLEATECGVKVKKDGMEYDFYFEEDCGDCCGYNTFNAYVLYEKDSNRNPVITKVDVEDGGGEHDSLEITFFGESKALAKIESESGSGSGWCYGATVSLIFKPSDNESLELELTSW